MLSQKASGSGLVDSKNSTSFGEPDCKVGPCPLLAAKVPFDEGRRPLKSLVLATALITSTVSRAQTRLEGTLPHRIDIIYPLFHVSNLPAKSFHLPRRIGSRATSFSSHAVKVLASSLSLIERCSSRLKAKVYSSRA